MVTIFCYRLVGHVDIAMACSATTAPLETGSALLVIELVKGDNPQMADAVETVLANNIVQMSVMVDCDTGR